MPTIAGWADLPPNVRQHLLDRMRDRAITISDLNQLRLWIESQPEVPDGDWYRDFGSFKICGEGKFPKTFLLRSQANRLSDEDSRPEGASRVEGSVPNRYTEKWKCGLLAFLGSGSYRLP